MKIIINADDLGLTKESNYGILKMLLNGDMSHRQH